MVVPDVNRARSLRKQISSAWHDEPIPQIPESYKHDVVFFQDYYEFVAGKRWEELDLESYIGYECWIGWSPIECQRYYVAAYLAYAVSWTGPDSNPRFDKDYSFNCLAPTLVGLGKYPEEFSAAQRECICSVIEFCLQYLEELFGDFIDVFGELLEAQEIWQFES